MTVSLGGLRIMYGATVVGAGSFGLTHLIHPQVFTKLLNAPANSNYIMSDGFIGSAFLGFAYMSAKALKSGKDEDLVANMPILKLQVFYKTYWCIAFLVKYFQGKLELSKWNSLYFIIMSGFVVGDMVAFHTGPKEDKKKK